jgi:hypothetical protein
VEIVAGLWVTVGLPAVVLAPLAVERGRSPWWGLLGLASVVGLVIGLICLFSMEPGNQPERIAYARLERGEITPEEYERILAAVAGRARIERQPLRMAAAAICFAVATHRVRR